MFFILVRYTDIANSISLRFIGSKIMIRFAENRKGKGGDEGEEITGLKSPFELGEIRYILINFT